MDAFLSGGQPNQKQSQRPDGGDANGVENHD